jgi:adenylyltransferase/sulfurtransferase
MNVINITSKELEQLIKNEPDNIELIDVREPDEFAIVRFKNAKLFPGNVLLEKLDGIDWTRKVVFYCYSGSRSRLSALVVSSRFDKAIYNHVGGISDYYWTSDRSLLDINGEKIGGYI